MRIAHISALIIMAALAAGNLRAQAVGDIIGEANPVGSSRCMPFTGSVPKWPVIRPAVLFDWKLQALDAGLDAADGLTTARLLRLPGTFEYDPILGRHPSPARIGLTFAAEAALRAGVVYELRKHHHARTARALLIGTAALEGGCITNNLIRIKGLSR